MHDDTLNKKIQDYMHKCHQASVESGWWHDLETGERLERNKGEMLCLLHSEISESHEAFLSGLMDDKLPHIKGELVELADAAIRLFDYALGHGYQLAFITSPSFHLKPVLLGDFARVHLTISNVMEAERKGIYTAAEARLKTVLFWIMALFNDLSSGEANFFEVIDEKLEFNRTRSDHKAENRRKAHGKRW